MGCTANTDCLGTRVCDNGQCQATCAELVARKAKSAAMMDCALHRTSVRQPLTAKGIKTVKMESVQKM